MEEKQEKDNALKLPHRYHHDTLSPMATYRALSEYYFLFHEKMSVEELEVFFRNIETTRDKIDNRNARFSEIINLVQQVLDLQEMHGGPYDVIIKLNELNVLLEEINDKKK